jgi:hypothetical protein
MKSKMNQPTPRAELDFASIEVGREYGVHDFILDAELVRRWLAVYSAVLERDKMPEGMLAVVSIRAYMAILPNRPPGGVHASQRYEIFRLPSVGDLLQTSMRCISKAEKSGRLWVELETATRTSDGTLHFKSVQTNIWAR